MLRTFVNFVNYKEEDIEVFLPCSWMNWSCTGRSQVTQTAKSADLPPRSLVRQFLHLVSVDIFLWCRCVVQRFHRTARPALTEASHGT